MGARFEDQKLYGLCGKTLWNMGLDELYRILKSEAERYLGAEYASLEESYVSSTEKQVGIREKEGFDDVGEAKGMSSGHMHPDQDQPDSKRLGISPPKEDRKIILLVILEKWFSSQFLAQQQDLSHQL